MLEKMLKAVGVLFAMVFLSGISAVAEVGIESFEGKDVPVWLQYSGSGELGFTKSRFQHGEQSLVWRWEGQDALLIDTVAYAASSRTPSDFMVWIYAAEPNGALDISWGSRESVTKGNAQRIRYHLNFTGWRSLWLRLNSDGLGEGQTPSTLETIQIAPTADSGELYFDMLELTDRAIMHGRLGSDQMPFVVNDPANRHNYPWIARQYKRTEPLPAATPENLKHVERIEESLRQIYGAADFGRPDKALNGYRTLQKKTRIQGDTLVGPHVSSHIVERYYRQKGREGIHIHDMQGALYHVAKLYRETGDSQWKDLYFDYLQFHHDKGFAAGSAAMNLVFVAKNAANYLASLILMRPYFESETWAREAATVRWISGYNNLYNPQKDPVDADKMLGDLQTLLIAIHLQPDETDEQKLSKLYDYQQLSEIIRITMEPGVDGADRLYRIVRPDYSVYHHGQEMVFSYGYAAAQKYLQYFYIFRDGPARLDADPVKAWIEMYPRLLTQQGNGPITGTRGVTAGDGGGFFNMLNYAAAADIEEAKPWLKYFYQTGAITDSNLLFNSREEIINNPSVKLPEHLSGNWYQPYAGMLVHRRDDWMAVLRGMNQSTPSPEMFGSPQRENCANVFGDQQGYGFLQLIANEGVAASGFDLNRGGWDWSLYPGATTLRLSNDFLKNAIATGKVTFNQRTLCGGLSHFNRNGLYYQRLHAGPESRLVGIDGHKSWFFFDDIIICLGSGLKAPSIEAPMATTLFQYRHSSKQNPDAVYVAEPDSALVQKISSEMQEKSLGDHAMNLMDPLGHIYHVPSGNSVMLRRGMQHSQDHRRPFRETSGYYSTVWLDHGTLPSSAGYEYAVKVFGGEPLLPTFKANGLYEVLQKDNRAHIVHYLPKQAYGYVFLSATDNNPQGPVLAVDKPVLAMATQREGLLELTLSDPDPDVHASDRSVVHEVTVRGEWSQVICPSERVKIKSSAGDGKTTIALELKDGISVDLILKKQ